MSAHPHPDAAPGAQPAASQAISQRIAEFACALRYEDISGPLREFARLHILDTVGCALAATRSDFARRALVGLAPLAEGGACSVIGMDTRLGLRDAVLLNGILAHGLDYDDTHTEAIVHPSSSAFPCALGIAEFVGASGADLLTAYLVAVEIAVRVGIAARGAMHAQGFHTTGIAGHFGCALAAGRLLGLDAQRMALAQGLAGSTAAAIAEHRADGAWNKRMHPGWAGVGGITAASLARGGYLGTQRVYEGVDGLLRTHTGSRYPQVDAGALTEGLGKRWRAAEVAVKPFPICHILHACADAALALKHKHALAPDTIAEVRVLLHPDSFHSVCEPVPLRRRPTSEYVAKFSAHYVVAACLVRGKFGFAELEPEALEDPRILALAQRVSHDVDPESQFPRYFSGGVVVTTVDGRTLTHMERINRGNGERALTAEQIVAKFMDNAETVLPRARAEAVRDLVLGLDRAPARNLARALGAP